MLSHSSSSRGEVSAEAAIDYGVFGVRMDPRKAMAPNLEKEESLVNACFLIAKELCNEQSSWSVQAKANHLKLLELVIHKYEKGERRQKFVDKIISSKLAPMDEKIEINGKMVDTNTTKVTVQTKLLGIAGNIEPHSFRPSWDKHIAVVAGEAKKSVRLDSPRLQ